MLDLPSPGVDVVVLLCCTVLYYSATSPGVDVGDFLHPGSPRPPERDRTRRDKTPEGTGSGGTDMQNTALSFTTG